MTFDQARRGLYDAADKAADSMNDFAKQTKKSLNKGIKCVNNYTINKSVNADLAVKSKEPEKTLFHFRVNYNKEWPVLKAVSILLGIAVVFIAIKRLSNYCFLCAHKHEIEKKLLKKYNLGEDFYE